MLFHKKPNFANKNLFSYWKFASYNMSSCNTFVAINALEEHIIHVCYSTEI